MTLNFSINHIKFISIILLFIQSLLRGRNARDKRDSILLQLGLFFTVFADLFLTVLGFNVPGVAMFCFVQIIYIARYDIIGFGSTIKWLSFSLLILICVLLLLTYYGDLKDFTIPVSVFYSICLYTSVNKSIKAVKYNKGTYPHASKYLIPMAMILFLLGDINVALSYLKIHPRLTSKLVWVFYLPSQILLVESIGDVRKDENSL